MADKKAEKEKSKEVKDKVRESKDIPRASDNSRVKGGGK